VGSHALFDYWSFVIKHFSKRTFPEYSTIDDVEDKNLTNVMLNRSLSFGEGGGG